MCRIFVKPLYDVSTANSIQFTLEKNFTRKKINTNIAAVKNPEAAVRQKSLDLSPELFCHKSSGLKVTKQQHGGRA